MNKLFAKGRKWLLLSAAVYMLCAILETAFALVLGYVVDDAVSGQLSALIRHVIWAIFLLIGNLFFYWLAVSARRSYVMNCVSSLKSSLMGSAYRRGLRSFREASDSFYINLLSNDVDTVEEDYLLPKPILLFYAGQFIFSLAALFYISWKATLFFFLFFLIPLVVPQLLSGLLAKQKKAASDANEGFTFVLKEHVQGMTEIVQNLSVSAFLHKFSQANHAQQQAKKKAGITQTFINELSAICGGIAQLGCMAVGGVLVINGEMSVGELIASIQLLNSVFSPINGFSQALAQISGTKPIREKMEEALQIEAEKSTKKISSSEIVYTDFSTWYEAEKPLIKSFSHQFVDGKTYAVIGDSGIGKTTLFKCLMKTHDQYSGRIQVGGVDLQELSGDDIYQRIGYVPQNPYIFNETLVQNITMSGSYSQNEVQAAIQKVHLSKMAEQNSKTLGDSGEAISGGEKQRIALARTLIRQPNVIIFDEPTTALDPDTRDSINALIFSLHGYTRIVITHDRRTEYLNRFDEVISL